MLLYLYIMIRQITLSEYDTIEIELINYFINNEIKRDFIYINLSKEDFMLSALISSFNPISIDYIGLKSIYNNIENDYNMKITKNSLKRFK